MSNTPAPLILVNTVGLTDRLVRHAPCLSQLAEDGWKARLNEPWPAVTCTAQATILTGALPEKHGIVANGWLFRDTMEVRFWHQSNRLLLCEPIYETARRRALEVGRSFSAAKLFWWFNQGAAVDYSLTPKPYYGADGDKRFAISGFPQSWVAALAKELGPFPFPAFWGPQAGLAGTRWIAEAAGFLLRGKDRLPELTLVYLPHLDYDLQRCRPEEAVAQRSVRELDQAVQVIAKAAERAGAQVWIVNEYGHRPVSRPVLPNRALRAAGMLQVRDGPFGETLETFQSAAFAVCDHQIAHVYVHPSDDAKLVKNVAKVLEPLEGVATVLGEAEKTKLGLGHARSGELVLIAQPDAWFAYPYWLDDRKAPDFARCVDIHRKPGFDPCELFFDPKLWWPHGRVAWRLVQKKLGFRTLFDLIPLDPRMVGGSHGLPAERSEDRPLLIGQGPKPAVDGDESLPMTAVHDLVLAALGLAG